jgi:anti-anti-sigma factor
VAMERVHSILVYDRRTGRREQAMARWISRALGRREKVLYELARGEDPDRVLRSSRARVGTDAVAAGQLEVIEAERLRAESGGAADGLAKVHRTRLHLAREEGWAGLAVASGGAVLTAVSRDEATGLVHERGVTRIVVEDGMSALCCYSTGEAPNLVDAMLAAHHADVEDELWAADVVGDRLRVRGEIDASNADRIVPVLLGALAAGVRFVDVGGLRFCAAAGVRSFAAAADTLQDDGDALVLANPGAGLRMIFALAGLLDHPCVRIVPTPER